LIPQNATKQNKLVHLLQKEHTSLKYDVNSEGLRAIACRRVGRNMRSNVARNLVCVVNAAPLRYQGGTIAFNGVILLRELGGW